MCTSAGKNIVIGIRKGLDQVLSLYEIERLIHVIFDTICYFLFTINKYELTKAGTGQGPAKQHPHARVITSLLDMILAAKSMDLT